MHRLAVQISVVAVAIAIFLGLFSIQVAKNPLRLDEVDYFGSIQNLAEIGVPIFYAGEVEINPDLLVHLSTRTLSGQTYEFYKYRPETGVQKEAYFALVDGHSRYTYGMWHPPLYIYLASLAYRLYPLTPANSELLRVFNLVFSVGVVIGIARLGKTLYPQHARSVFIGALVLYLFNSLNLRGSSLIDYNATLAPCVVVWFTVAFAEAVRRERISTALAAVTLLSFFVGFGVAAVVVLGATVWIVAFQLRRIPWRAVASVAAGGLIFVPVFWVFCSLLDLPFAQPFIYNFWRSGIKPSNPWMAGRVEMTVRYIVLYSREIGLFVVVVASLLTARVLSRRGRDVDGLRGLLPAVIFPGLMLHALVGANAWGFMKYILFAIPLICVFVVGEGCFIGDRASRVGRSTVTLLFTVALLVELVVTVRVLTQPGGNLYLSEDQGTVEAARVVQRNSGPDEVILSAKDIAFFAERRFVDWTGWRVSDVAYVEAAVRQHDVRCAIQRSGTHAVLPDDVIGYLDDHFPAREIVGGYTILARDFMSGAIQ